MKTKSNDHKRHRSKWIVVGVAATMLLLTAVVRSFLFPAYEPLPPTGPYAVAAARYTYIDENRADPFAAAETRRKINATVWHPQPVAGAERFPLIIFSHGGLGLETSNESLYLELASHGYVVWAIGHPGHALWTRNVDGRLAFVNWDYFQALQRENARGDREQSFNYYQEWLTVRAGDLNLALDIILEQAANGADEVYRLVDVDRIGVVGHSLGGAAALALPRQRDDVAAVVALEAPFLYDIVGVADGEFVWREEAYPTPALNIYSDSSWNYLQEWPQYGRNAAWLSEPPATAVNLHIPGAGHFSLTDLTLVSPPLTRFLEGEAAGRDGAAYLRAVNQACLTFLDRHLK